MFSYIFPAVGQIRDFHPLECVHAGHTMLRLFQSRCAGFVFRRSTPFALPCGSLRWLRSAGSALGGSAAEKKKYLFNTLVGT